MYMPLTIATTEPGDTVSTFHRVDVVIANGEPAQPLSATAPAPAETEKVDVAPDPSQRIILLALTKKAGQDEADRLGVTPVAIVTPRSPHAARGMTADLIVDSPDLTPEQRNLLYEEAGPALATTQGE